MSGRFPKAMAKAAELRSPLPVLRRSRLKEKRRFGRVLGFRAFGRIMDLGGFGL